MLFRFTDADAGAHREAEFQIQTNDAAHELVADDDGDQGRQQVLRHGDAEAGDDSGVGDSW